MRIFTQIAAWSIALACFTSCDTTKIVSTYESPDEELTYTNLYVVGISGEAIPEDQMENQLVKTLEEEGFVAAADEDIFEHDRAYNEDVKNYATNLLEEREFDALLTFSLINKEEDVDFNAGPYSPGMYPTSGTPYNTYWRYYGYYAPQAYATGYYTKSTVYHLEANLYDSQTGKRVWGVRSKAVDPERAAILSQDFAETITEELIRQEIIVPTNDTAMN